MSPPSSSSSSSAAAAARASAIPLLVGSALALGALALSCLSLVKALGAQQELTTTRRKLKKEMDLRKMERAGRTKAERRLRKELKALIKGQTDGGVNLKPIARIRSPFKGRCGTPRQGLLAPHARGTIVLEPGICRTSLDQVGAFSHIWVLFLFDQNTNWTDALCASGPESQRFTFTAKIAPPRLFGKRVGVFSTRSPHRPNPVGLTVVRVESVDEKAGCIHVSGVDMTDGTPILDVKPYIPYDVVPDHRVPEWVVAEDVPSWALAVSARAEEALREIVARRQSPFYATYEEMVALLRDVLLQDPRSVHQGRGKVMEGAGGGGGGGEEEEEEEVEPYTCNIDDIAVQFLALPDAIHVVNAFEEARYALDKDDDEEDGGEEEEGETQAATAAKARAQAGGEGKASQRKGGAMQ